MVQSISLCRERRTGHFPLIQHTSTFCFLLFRNAYCFSRTLENVMQFAVYLEVIKRNTDDVASGTRQHHPPVCQELACRSISHILPQNRLISSSCLTPDQVRNGVRHCLLPQSIPNLLLCCLKPAPTPHLVFCLNQYCHLKKLNVSVRHLSA